MLIWAGARLSESPWLSSQVSAAASSSMSPDSSTTMVPLWLGAIWALRILAAMSKSTASR